MKESEKAGLYGATIAAVPAGLYGEEIVTKPLTRKINVKYDVDRMALNTQLNANMQKGDSIRKFYTEDVLKTHKPGTPIYEKGAKEMESKLTQLNSNNEKIRKELNKLFDKNRKKIKTIRALGAIGVGAATAVPAYMLFKHLKEKKMNHE